MGDETEHQMSFVSGNGNVISGPKIDFEASTWMWFDDAQRVYVNFESDSLLNMELDVTYQAYSALCIKNDLLAHLPRLSKMREEQHFMRFTRVGSGMVMDIVR